MNFFVHLCIRYMPVCPCLLLKSDILWERVQCKNISYFLPIITWKTALLSRKHIFIIPSRFKRQDNLSFQNLNDLNKHSVIKRRARTITVNVEQPSKSYVYRVEHQTLPVRFFCDSYGNASRYFHEILYRNSSDIYLMIVLRKSFRLD